MKITCQSCQSKYTVSDEKVQGKTVKIKCRKCGATILVNSSGATTTNGTAAESASVAAATSDGGVSFLVNVAEGDQRSMSLPEIIDAYNSSVITAETYVWADGMSDWQPLGQVDTIVAALNNPAAVAAPAEPEPAPPVAMTAPEPSVSRAAARRDPGRRAQDVFSGGAPADDVATSAPLFSAGSSAGPSRSAGGRASEENSMLFSLSALTAKTGSPSSSGAGISTAATREDSGLIDLKALAASAGPSPSATSSAAILPDQGLFQLAAPPIAAATGAPPIAAPSLPPPAANKTPLFIGIGALVAAIAIVGAFFAMKGGGETPAPAADSTQAAQSPPVPTATETAVAPPPTATATAEASAEPTASASAAPVAVKTSTKTTYKAPTGTSTKSPNTTSTAKSGTSTPPPKKSSCGCAPGDLMCAMKCSAK